MKKILLFAVIMMMAGCSCSNQTIQPSPTPSAKPTTIPSASPSASPESMNSGTKNYLDYLSGNYTLKNLSTIDNLDANAMEGYTFGYDSADLYLLRFDRSNQTASTWMDEAQSNGYIEVKINGEMKKYYALVNQDYMLLYENENLDSGFKDTFTKYQIQDENESISN